jgi:hypothetical protein
MREGISPGWGDNYDAILEGQFVDVTGVAAGRYYLVHRANANRKLVESDYDNDAASLLISLSWPHGRSHRPRVAVLGSCPDAEVCPAGPVFERPLLDGLAIARQERVVPYALDYR